MKEYQVFLQKEGPGDLWIREKTSEYFVVEGTADLKFSWEAKAKQRGYEYERLEVLDESGDETVNYEALAVAYLSEYEKEIMDYEESD